MLATVVVALFVSSLALSSPEAHAMNMPAWAEDFVAAGDAFEGGGDGGGGGGGSLHPERYTSWSWADFASRCDDVLADLITGETECRRLARIRWIVEPACRDFPENRTSPGCTDPSWWFDIP